MQLLSEEAKTEAMLDELDPEVTPSENVYADFQAISAALAGLDVAEQALIDAVRLARSHGRSWTQIGQAFGISRQAARQRFGARVA